MQLFGFQNEPWAQGVEIGLLFYALQPGILTSLQVGSFSPAVTHSVLAAALYFGYNSYLKQMM